jgi:hypothetical protein
MSDLSYYVYLDGDHFYFDSENYNEGEVQLTIKYEDGDMIKWSWEGKKMTGVIREEGYNLGLFKIENVKTIG